MEAWMWLSVALLAMVFLMSLFYGDCLLRRVSPKSCGATFGTFVVDPGFSQTIRNDCPGNGSNNSPCVFSIKTLPEAVARCNLDECQSFYFEPGRMTYSVPGTSKKEAIGGTYTRIGKIVNNE